MNEESIHLGADGFRMPLDALTRHAVCLGATGSGKTALCLDLIEEALVQGVPVLALDPKGDLGNLLLTFAEPTAEALAPWVDDAVVRRAGGDRRAAAEGEASRWRQGWHDSGVEPGRAAVRLARAVATLYSPGSDVGRSLALLGDLGPATGNASPEAERERAQTTAAALLALAGVEAEPGRSREHTLLTALLLHGWHEGQRWTLPALVAAVQRPPLTTLGVLDLETYYPASDRFTLVLALNHLLASPASLLTGDSPSIDDLLRARDGRPRLAIVTLAHLDEPSRQAFVTALLGQLTGWLRRQPGQSSLRALVLLDEAAGYLPPVASPPTKAPLLTLIKQARARGLGLVLATQNAADLDHKALANVGTWMIGRLSSARDRQRALDALAGSDFSGALDDAPDLDARLASLPSRGFLCHGFWTSPRTFVARWPLAYLRGPLGLDEMRRLPVDPEPAAATTTVTTSPAPVKAPEVLHATHALAAPPLHPGVKQLFAPSVHPELPYYEPSALAAVRVRYLDRKQGIDEVTELTLTAPLPDLAREIDWSMATRPAQTTDAMDASPVAGATFAPPAGSVTAATLRGWQARLLAHLTQHEERRGWWSPQARLASDPGESEPAFRARLALRLAQGLDDELARQSQASASRRQSLEQRVQRAEQALARQQERANEARADVALSAGAALLGGLFGGGRGVAGKAVKTVKQLGRASHRGNEVARARQDVDDARAALARFDHEARQAAEALRAAWLPERVELEPIQLRPTRAQIEVLFLGVGWWPAA